MMTMRKREADERTMASSHARRLLRLRGIRCSPVARVAVTGEGAAVGIVLWLQGRNVRIELR